MCPPRALNSGHWDLAFCQCSQPLTSGGNNDVNLGEGNDVANFKESNRIHLIEVDESNNGRS